MERFWNKVFKTNGCWLWLGAKDDDGYGRFHLSQKQKSVGAHRVAFVLSGNKIPDGLQIDHLCRNRACVNPAHMEAVTSRINTQRGLGGWQKYLTHCKNGHPFDNDNTYRLGSRRICRQCNRNAVARYQASMK